MREMKNIAIYARVSTTGQETENQLQQLRDYANRRGLAITGEYIDKGVSGGKTNRPQLDALMKHAKAVQFDGIVVWKFDRFGRSLLHLVKTLDDLHALGIHFVSLTEAVDTSTPSGRAFFQVMGVMAEFERGLIVERVNAGLRRARKEGKTLGRPRVIADREKVSRLANEGLSVRKIATKLHLTKSTVHNLLSAKSQRQ
jgi:DNA invertase Pin-like site-specific DNA recombinase